MDHSIALGEVWAGKKSTTAWTVIGGPYGKSGQWLLQSIGGRRLFATLATLQRWGWNKAELA